MTATPIPGTGFVTTNCVTGCGAHVVVIPERTDTAHCSAYLIDHINRHVITGRGLTWGVEYTPPATTTYPPAHYPPTDVEPAALRLPNPDVAGYCLSDTHRGKHNANLHLMSLNPVDIHLAHTVHDATHHRAWLIGGPGGANDDICNPCGGAANDSKTALIDGPRHDLCLRGRARGRGRNCECNHGSHMRGVKPATAVDRVRAHRTANDTDPVTPEPAQSPPAAPVTNYLFDPEDFDPGDTDADPT